MSEHEMITVETKPCQVCAKTSIMSVDRKAFERWDNGKGDYIQVAFPDMSADDREMLLTGTHPVCWNRLLGDTDDEEWDI